MQVDLCVDSKSWTRYVHHLVLLAFVGARPPGTEARHLDGDPTNNAPENLAWGTHQENFMDCVKHGTDTRGVRNGAASLTQEQVDEIRGSTEMGRVLARKFNVSEATISVVRNWKKYTVR